MSKQSFAHSCSSRNPLSRNHRRLPNTLRSCLSHAVPTSNCRICQEHKVRQRGEDAPEAVNRCTKCSAYFCWFEDACAASTSQTTDRISGRQWIGAWLASAANQSPPKESGRHNTRTQFCEIADAPQRLRPDGTDTRAVVDAHR